MARTSMSVEARSSRHRFRMHSMFTKRTNQCDISSLKEIDLRCSEFEQNKECRRFLNLIKSIIILILLLVDETML